MRIWLSNGCLEISYNYPKKSLNQEKYQLLVSRCTHRSNLTRIEQKKILKSKKQKLLREEIDRGLKFDEYQSSLYIKSSEKVAFTSLLELEFEYYYLN